MKQDNNLIAMVVIVAFVSMIGPFSIDTYLPSFPSIEAEFGSSRSQLSQSIAFYMIATAISSLFWGPLSDRLGRKHVISGSLFFYSIASLGCALATDYSEFLLFRIFQGMAASGGLVAGRAMVRDVYDSNNAQRVMAYVLMLFALAPAIAPIIGGLLHELFGWRSIFYFLCLYGVTMLLLSSFILSETLHKSKQQSFHPFHVLRIYARTLLHLRFLTIVISLGFSFGGLFVYIAGAPTVMFDFLSLESTDFWIQFVPMTAGIIVGSFLAGKLTRHWSSVKTINLAFVIMFIGMVINVMHSSVIHANSTQSSLFLPEPIWIIAPIVIYAFGVALSMPGLGILALDCFPDNRGAASAVQSFSQIMMSGLVAGLMLPSLPQSITAYASLQMLLLIAGLLLWGISGLCKK
ncbi:MAG: Bcr/CflA family drug resistance efflux transporter [endosymbiont of Galathealinum brachiosum]|uniref:Bcr/CflA family efflux transporter n=1 Tax=endosymbiont of Galathealinum brachiosum TaxID=2200906 RepID=A0A370D9N3_9GAMM|nr:MAG: Bcr/CflA family drug resistance efflux transporter [endosymbiont of Galathealinum brachiosum]